MCLPTELPSTHGQLLKAAFLKFRPLDWYLPLCSGCTSASSFSVWAGDCLAQPWADQLGPLCLPYLHLGIPRVTCLVPQLERASANKHSQISSFPICTFFFPFSCLIALARTCSTVSKSSGEREYPCVTPGLKQSSGISLLIRTLAAGFCTCSVSM